MPPPGDCCPAARPERRKPVMRGHAQDCGRPGEAAGSSPAARRAPAAGAAKKQAAFMTGCIIIKIFFKLNMISNCGQIKRALEGPSMAVRTAGARRLHAFHQHCCRDKRNVYLLP
jgi:hypothetical protein